MKRNMQILKVILASILAFQYSSASIPSFAIYTFAFFGVDKSLESLEIIAGIRKLNQQMETTEISFNTVALYNISWCSLKNTNYFTQVLANLLHFA
jgi:hypothetical protein